MGEFREFVGIEVDDYFETDEVVEIECDEDEVAVRETIWEDVLRWY